MLTGLRPILAPPGEMTERNIIFDQNLIRETNPEIWKDKNLQETCSGIMNGKADSP